MLRVNFTEEVTVVLLGVTNCFFIGTGDTKLEGKAIDGEGCSAFSKMMGVSCCR